jgi:hypothetical protein
MDEFGRREPARQLGGAHAAKLELGAVDHIRIADLAGRAAGRDVDAIVADQMAQLLGQIGTEQAGRRWSWRRYQAGSAGRRRARRSEEVPPAHRRCAAPGRRKRRRRGPLRVRRAPSRA